LYARYPVQQTALSLKDQTGQMKKVFLLFLLLPAVYANAQKTLQERLGYAKDAKLLILHADDLGMSHSENAATFYGMEHGSVNSASIMMPTPWIAEAVNYQHNHREADFGLHLTLTSEWNYLKWGSVASSSNVPGLLNKNGFFFSSVDSVYKSATDAEVEKELRAQIEKAKRLGIDITHLDSHMGTLFGRTDYLKVLIKLAREYKLPVLLCKPIFKLGFQVDLDSLTTDKDVTIDMIYMAYPQDYKNGMENVYTGILRSLKSGVSEIIFHAGYNDSEMQAATIGHPDYGAEWRQADFDFFSSDKCKALLK